MRIGIDLGGTKTEIICLNQNNGKEIYRHRVPTERAYEATIKNIASMVKLAEETIDEEGTVGVGIPGTVSSVTGLVKNANSTWLIGKPLDKDLEEALGRPVKVQNDANCFAVSEATDGAAAGQPVVFGVIIGTGCGAGIAINGQALPGINGIAGEWGHNPLPYPNKDETPGPECYCGRYGCMETWISGPGFKNDYQMVTGEELSTHDIIEAANKEEKPAVKALERYVDRLARGLAGAINILDPDVIVLGGGMSNISRLYKDVPEIWGKYIFSDTIDTVLMPPRFGDSSGVRGAAWLWNSTNP
jgi:fructokinase